MKSINHAIAVFPDHSAAERAVKTLGKEGFALSDLSIIGKGYHTDEKVIGFYNVGERVMFWGKRGAFWGALWGWFLGGMVMTVPVAGQVVVLGYLATVAISIFEGAALLGGFGALGAALYSLGIPKDSVISYETALEADNFLVMARGAEEDVERARKILHEENPVTIDMHVASDTLLPAQAL